MHLWQAYLTGLEVSLDGASPGYPSGYFFFLALLPVSTALRDENTMDLRISGTIGAANVLTPGAYLGSIREESRTFMASASNSLLWLLKHQGLPTGLGIRPGQGNLLPQSVVGIRLDRPWNHGGIGFLLLALASWLPRGVSGARLASDVLAFRTHFVASIRRAAQVAGSVDAHADWLLDPVDVLLWSSR